MKTTKILVSLAVVGFLTTGFAEDNAQQQNDQIAQQVAAIQEASPEDGATLMNEVKQNIASMDAEQRDAAIATVQSHMHEGHNDGEARENHQNHEHMEGQMHEEAMHHDSMSEDHMTNHNSQVHHEERMHQERDRENEQVRDNQERDRGNDNEGR